MFEKIKASLEEAGQSFVLKNSSRRLELERLAQWLTAKAAKGEHLQLVVICTHNSRRSHLGQFWATAASNLLGVPLAAFSGGTEATACHPNTLAALERAGAKVEKLNDGSNPRYRVLFGEQSEHGIEAWSKEYSDPTNPQKGFAALMVCSDADQGCPWVAGAEARFSLPYIDPKHADNTPEQDTAYDEASQTIAAEMAWVVAEVKKALHA